MNYKVALIASLLALGIIILLFNKRISNSITRVKSDYWSGYEDIGGTRDKYSGGDDGSKGMGCLFLLIIPLGGTLIGYILKVVV